VVSRSVIATHHAGTITKVTRTHAVRKEDRATKKSKAEIESDHRTPIMLAMATVVDTSHLNERAETPKIELPMSALAPAI
jgi:hypothetical protein